MSKIDKLWAMRSRLKAAVDNILDLPCDHPAIEPSFKAIQEFMDRRAEEIAADRGG